MGLFAKSCLASLISWKSVQSFVGVKNCVIFHFPWPICVKFGKSGIMLSSKFDILQYCCNARCKWKFSHFFNFLSKKKLRKRDVQQMYGQNFSSLTMGAVKYTLYTGRRKLNTIHICYMYRRIWAKSRSIRLYTMLLNTDEYPNCTGMFVLFVPTLIKLHLHMYREKL